MTVGSATAKTVPATVQRSVKFPKGRVSKVRSKILSGVRSKNTKAEVLLRKSLSALGLRYRLYKKELPGKPDVVFSKSRTIIFCDGDFWHGKDWENRRGTLKIRKSYWIAKIESNMARDQRINRELQLSGWKVLRFWESEILRDPSGVARKIQAHVLDGGVE